MIKNKLKPHSMGVITKILPNMFRPPFPAYEPMRRDRWILTIESELGPQMFFIRMDGGIHISNRIEEIPYMTPSTWLGRMSWDPIKFKIIDAIGDNSNLDYFHEWMISHTEMLTGRQGYAAGYKRNLKIEKVDPTGVVIESWILYGALITEMRHEVVMDRDMSDIEITINFDRAVLVS